MRLNKYLAHCGVCSRRDADKLIDKGAVLVNGRQATPGQLVGDGDEVLVSGRRVQNRQETVVLAFYKPLGVTCTERDSHAERIVSDLVDYPVRVTYAGRLDKDSEGLLLLSNDGDLIQAMMKGANRHEKEYLVRVNKEITPELLRDMSGGVYLEELGITTRECKVEQESRFVLRMVLTQGVNRQIKRMCRACGYHVRTLKRVRVMHVTLGDLKPGEYRELSAKDVERLYRDCGLRREQGTVGAAGSDQI
ncbi:MAG: pseudouridine synthase [Lachnospiraceae bacterium]|nr:pseudouridine synthase [Lachnospiraceae bacterium]